MSKRFLFTTPIYYVTDPPHLGHAYTTVVGDVLARFHRTRGDDTRYLTGTDEHGQKIERMAAARGKPPREFAGAISGTYREAWDRLGIELDDFIRTTEKRHEDVVVELWQRMVAKGDIELRDYEGWYCVPCEQYYTEKELTDGNCCPVHARPVEKVKEKTFFFKLSKYQKPLQDFYDHVMSTTGRPFVEPQSRMNEVRAFVDAGLDDLSASRTTFSWGVPVPDKPGHVIYVWIDALTNYYSATRGGSLAGFWPEPGDDSTQVVHLMGKEITRFHAIYWPAILMSAGIAPPSKIVAHGWWTVDGNKMSKTQGNVVDPLRLVADLDALVGAGVGVDAFRYFVLREVPLGLDGDFSHEALIARYNAELCNDLGNLLNRTLGMAHRYFEGRVSVEEQAELRAVAERAAASVDKAMDEFAPSRALDAIWELIRAANGFIERSAPWKQSKEDQSRTLGAALETCRHLAHLLHAFIPGRATEMLRQLGLDEKPARPQWAARAFAVTAAAPIFPRIDEDKKKELLLRWAPRPVEGEAGGSAAALTATSPSPSTSTSASVLTSASVSASAAASASGAKALIAYEDFARLDLRVARIAAAERVPRKDKLLKLSVDLGNGELRTVVAGVGATYAPEALVDKRVIFLANLKPAKIGGILSEGMLLAAGDPEVLALSALDRECAPGTKVK